MENNDNKPEDKNQHLWDTFARLGERIGDGDMDADEARWVNREYKRLSRILVPEINEVYKKQRQAKAIHINEKMAKLLAIKKCDCGGTLEQSRSGSKIAYCKVCNKRYKASKSKK
jgi:hypothetical protein